MKKCRNCGATDAMSSTREARPLDSLPAVIVHRLKVTRCGACGAESVSIPRLEELHEVVAKALVQRPGRLTGPEVRYLRKWMGWSGRDFAEKFELTPEHVSRVENDRHPISAVADKLLRVLVLTRTPTPEYSPEDVLTKSSDAVPFSLGVAGADDRWQAVA